MIYEIPPADAPIRQGDIFRAVPRIDSELAKLVVVTADGTVESSWEAAANDQPGEPIFAVLGIRPVYAVVITQDCDAIRAPTIALCEIGPFPDVLHQNNLPNTPAKWVNLITQQARFNQKWFYLPQSAELGFNAKMAVDFQVVMRLRREDIDAMRQTHRIGRLNDLAEAHFRERLGDFFRRYPYDEWYPFNKEEFEAYKAKWDEPVQPFPYQQ